MSDQFKKELRWITQACIDADDGKLSRDGLITMLETAIRNMSCEPGQPPKRDQAKINQDWLIARMDEAHDVLCPDVSGTWQMRVEQVVEAARKKFPTGMEIVLGKAGLVKTFQDEFPETTACCRCDCEARIGFVAAEVGGRENGPFVCDLHKNDPKGEGFWMHDCCSVAVYFCKKCLEPTALYNQA